MTTNSSEQNEIIQSGCENIVIDAVAGSGKTTTIINIVKRYPSRNHLVLTYNRRLKEETRAKCLALNNVEIHSFHSFCVKYVSRKCFDDSGIVAIFKGNPIPRSLLCYNCIIVDETQDLTIEYFEIILFIVKHNLGVVNLIVVGDIMQNIYKFKGSSDVFLRNHNIFGRKLTPLTLNTTFRLTKPMVNFVNGCMGIDKLISHKDGVKPYYIASSAFNTIHIIVRKFISDGYKPQDIFVLTASTRVKGRNPIISSANMLSKSGVAVFVSDNDSKNELETLNKVVFTTFHQAKGLERKVVIVNGFDSNYFEYFNKGVDDTRLPNELYVAITRASEQLVLIQSSGEPFKFLPDINLLCDCRFLNHDIKDRVKLDTQIFEVLDLVRFVRNDIIDLCMSKLCFMEITPPIDTVITESLKKYSFEDVEIYENISDILGIAVPIYIDALRNGDVTKDIQYFKKTKDGLIISKETLEIKHDLVISIQDGDQDALIKLFMKCLEVSVSISGRTFRLNQIGNTDWLDVQTFLALTNNLESQIFGEIKMEQSLKAQIDSNTIVVGRVDLIIEDKVLYELKCTDSLTTEHFLQLACYAFMSDYDEYKLFNIKTKQLWCLNKAESDIVSVINLLIDNKRGLCCIDIQAQVDMLIKKYNIE
jgi:hypothetical protein